DWSSDVCSSDLASGPGPDFSWRPTTDRPAGIRHLRASPAPSEPLAISNTGSRPAGGGRANPGGPGGLAPVESDGPAAPGLEFVWSEDPLRGRGPGPSTEPTVRWTGAGSHRRVRGSSLTRF